MFSKIFKNFFVLLVILSGSFILKSQTIPLYSVTICNEQSTGYYFMNSAKPGTMSNYSISFNMILDSTGDLFYFKKFTGDYKSNDFKVQQNGQMSYFSNNHYYLMDMAFKIVDSVACKNGLTVARQDMQILKNGHYLLLGEEQPLIDLSKYKLFKPNNCAGSTAATVICGGFQELDGHKNVVFDWRAKNHFTFLDMDTFFIKDPKILDWTHFNAVELDADGNYLLSVRNFDEIVKINSKDGSIIWHLGGRNNQFTFKNDTGRFLTQHDIRRLPNGNITLFDNGRGEIPIHPCAAKEYALDENAKTATLVWKHVHDSTVHSGAGLGNVQRLANGNTLVGYGRTNKSPVLFTLLTPDGKKNFEMQLAGGRLTYRAFNFSGITFKVKRPVIRTVRKEGMLYLDAGKGYKSYLWSTGETTRIIAAKANGTYKAFIPSQDGGWIGSLPHVVSDL
ncbi:hypothetical protein CNR22_11025 [Sphingobacteriaceae bacterium]|nr:hypothetical protein CNR22_11025 [Sphingobacteriaceae bacterium]